MFSAARARSLQEHLARLVRYEDDFGPLSLVAGMDVSYFRAGKSECGVGVVALLRYPSMRLVEFSAYAGPPPIPYIPGLLAFREAPLLLGAYSRLSREPDLIVVDGHGVTHPRGLGIASHMGLVLERPSIGVAKKFLAGRIEKDSQGRAVIYTPDGRIGGYLVEEAGRRRLYVSVGHRVSPLTAYRLVRSMRKPRRGLPEPTRIADEISHAIVKRIKSTGECSLRILGSPYSLDDLTGTGGTAF